MSQKCPKNKLKISWLMNAVCSNCNLQRTMKVWSIMECGCGCGAHSKTCDICSEEHTGCVGNPELYNKDTLCVLCAYINCKNKKK